jgi:hypothetical protein
VTETEREREAREALERVGRDSETIGSSSLARVGRRVGGHFAGQDALGRAEDGGTDPIELWGRRVGRALSLIGVVVLTYFLGVQLRLW